MKYSNYFKTSFLLFTLFFASVTKLLAQNIAAGENASESFFVEFMEEIELTAPNPLNFSSDSVYLDLNDDGLDDVIIDLANNPGGV